MKVFMACPLIVIVVIIGIIVIIVMVIIVIMVLIVLIGSLRFKGLGFGIAISPERRKSKALI